MDSFEWNKIFGAVLGTALFVFGLKIVGSNLFAGEIPEKPGYKIEVAEAAAGGETPEAGPKLSLGALLASADKDKGASKAKACAACHDFTKGGPNKTGPNLYGIIGHDVGVASGFAYSDAFKTMAGKKWGYEEMNAWLLAPKEYVKGTKMGFSGIKNDQDRANVIAYLASLTDAPVPFPAP